MTSSLTTDRARRATAVFLAAAVVALSPMVLGAPAGAAIVATVPLGTAAEYSVLAGTTVTNTGPTVLQGSLGVYPGTAVVGFFPPGVVLAPSTIQAGTAAAATAQGDLTAAYDDAAGRPLNATVPADLAGLTLVGGVYAATAKGPLGLTGTVTLDGAGDPSSVFIFQTDSTLITGTGSVVALINGAQPCNVFWQVGSSATLGVGTTFQGNVLALTSITVQTGATVEGRALARNGAVTLDSNVFTHPACNLTTTTSATTTSTTAAPSTTTSTTAATTTTVVGTTTTLSPGTTVPGSVTTTAPSTTAPASATSTSSTTLATSSTAVGSTSTSPPNFVAAAANPTTTVSRSGQPVRRTNELPRTGTAGLTAWMLLGGMGLATGAVLLGLRQRTLGS